MVLVVLYRPEVDKSGSKVEFYLKPALLHFKSSLAATFVHAKSFFVFGM